MKLQIIPKPIPFKIIAWRPGVFMLLNGKGKVVRRHQTILNKNDFSFILGSMGVLAR